MALVDSTNNSVTRTTTTDASSIVTKQAAVATKSATPNTEKLAAALDDIAGFAADARDTAEAKLNAAVTKDAPGTYERPRAREKRTYSYDKKNE